MPNQRKKGKTKVGLWVDDAQRERLAELAKANGKSMSDLIKEALHQYEEMQKKGEIA